tara:strand:+ start:1480 stop:1938 length:459 start_codon:yes stop_codon:yes gene_type:complete
MNIKIYLILILIPTLFPCTISFSKDRYIYSKNNIIPLSIKNHKINAEIADNDQSRATGLMFRKKINSNQGMLFKYESSKIHCMWMKDTMIPLSVAFINNNHKIIEIHQMKPLDETPHCSSYPSKYALEMRSGWFNKKKIKPGHKVSGIKDGG